jgi:hypothetical protein
MGMAIALFRRAAEDLEAVLALRRVERLVRDREQAITVNKAPR